MDPEELLKTALSAARSFLAKDSALLAADVHEQALTHRLGIYIEQLLPEWDVDCEYNRDGMTVKRLPVEVGHDLPVIGDDNGAPIKPDIIVHRRMEQDNQLVIEVKKLGNEDKGDDWKLRGMTSGDGRYSYKLGIHFIFDCVKADIHSVVCYTHGVQDAVLTAKVAEL